MEEEGGTLVDIREEQLFDEVMPPHFQPFSYSPSPYLLPRHSYAIHTRPPFSAVSKHFPRSITDTKNTAAELSPLRANHKSRFSSLLT
jgi:hypothetical protein